MYIYVYAYISNIYTHIYCTNYYPISGLVYETFTCWISPMPPLHLGHPNHLNQRGACEECLRGTAELKCQAELSCYFISGSTKIITHVCIYNDNIIYIYIYIYVIIIYNYIEYTDIIIY